MIDANAFMSLLSERRSCRAYSEREVSAEALNFCLEAARLSPSACNKQPWRFVSVRDAAVRADICSNCLLPGIPMPWLRKAPVIVALCCERQLLTHRLAPALSGVPYHYVDCGIAGEHFVLAAGALGLGTCWIGWIRPGKLKRLLRLPRNFKVISLISLGWPELMPEPRTRLALTEIARDEHWVQ